jgi:hypothetical protein
MLLDKGLINPSFNIYFIDFQYVNLVRQTFWRFFAKRRTLYLTMLIDFATIRPKLVRFAHNWKNGMVELWNDGFKADEIQSTYSALNFIF